MLFIDEVWPQIRDQFNKNCIDQLEFNKIPFGLFDASPVPKGCVVKVFRSTEPEKLLLHQIWKFAVVGNKEHLLCKMIESRGDLYGDRSRIFLFNYLPYGVFWSAIFLSYCFLYCFPFWRQRSFRFGPVAVLSQSKHGIRARIECFGEWVKAWLNRVKCDPAE